jgi:hypothetical protein
MKLAFLALGGELLSAALLMGFASHTFPAPATLTMLPDPILKPGLWEIVFTESTRKDFESTENLCAGLKAQEVQLAEKEFDARRSICKLNDVRSVKGLISYTGICNKHSGITATAQITLKGDFSKEFTRTETVSFSIPVPMEGMTQTQRFKYKGACPKDMAPGDIIMTFRDSQRVEKWNRYNPPQPSKAPPSTSK